MSDTLKPPPDADQVVKDAIAALRTPHAAAMLPDIERALRQSPWDARLWHLQGLIHRAQDRRELAIPALRKAVELAPGDPLIAHGFARALHEAGLPSVDAYASALRLTPGNTTLLAGLVSALLAERRIAEAIAGLERALERAPQWVEGHVLLCDLRWLEGERDGFARSFDEALALHPSDLALRRQQILTLLHAELYDEALARIAEGRRVLGDNILFDVNEAIVWSETGDRERADALFERLKDLADGSTQIRRVRHLLRSGRPADAVAAMEPWLESAEAFGFWPYAATAWRMTGDPRSEWLEGDERFVGIYDIADRLPPLDKLAGTLRALHTTKGQPLVQSVRGGTQTDGHLFHMIDPTIVALRNAIREVIGEHVARLPASDPAHPLLGPPREPISFSGAWSVRLQAGGFHSNHVHPLGWISSALYIVLPPDLGRDQAGWLTLGEPTTSSFPLDLPPTRLVEPKPGRLVLLPSWMWHGTRPFGEGERLTVAFDVAVPQQAGQGPGS
jgi:tetratricopeptide (TPR) repeat protein